MTTAPVPARKRGNRGDVVAASIVTACCTVCKAHVRFASMVPTSMRVSGLGLPGGGRSVAACRASQGSGDCLGQPRFTVIRPVRTSAPRCAGRTLAGSGIHPPPRWWESGPTCVTRSSDSPPRWITLFRREDQTGVDRSAGRSGDRMPTARDDHGCRRLLAARCSESSSAPRRNRERERTCLR